MRPPFVFLCPRTASPCAFAASACRPRSPPPPSACACRSSRVCLAPLSSLSPLTGQHLSAHYYYYSAIQVSRLDPPTGPTSGGSVVALHGRFAHLADVRCRFGSGSTSLVVPRTIDGTRIECTASPQAVPSTQLIQLTANGQQFAPSGVSFVYHAPIAVMSLLPAVTKSEGASIITLRTNTDLPLGALSRGYTFCRFDMIVAPATIRGAESLACAAP